MNDRLKKRNIARFVLYSELAKYYTAEEIDQMLLDIASGGTVDFASLLKKSDVLSSILPDSELPVQSKAVAQALAHIIPAIEDGAVTTPKIADGAVTFAKLSTEALEGIRTWLREHPEPGPEPPVTTATFDSTFDETFV